MGTTVTDAKIALEPRAVLAMPMGAALEATTAALKTEGFGVLTSIDVQATLREKLGESFDPYLILGACNPALAHRALSIDPDMGLLLPCNVVMHERQGSTTVSIVDPNTMLGIAGGNEALAQVASEASEKLSRVMATLQAQS